MNDIKVARQIVSDIHAFAPEGARKVVRNELTKRIFQPSTVEENESFRNLFIHSFSLKFKNYNNFASDYLLKIYEKEQGKLINKSLSHLGVKIQNKTGKEVDAIKLYNIVQGLCISKKGGLVLPKNVILDNNSFWAGSFYPQCPEDIYLRVINRDNDLCRVSIHETAHKNDKFIKSARSNQLFVFYNKVVMFFNSKVINDSIQGKCVYHRNEFIACTVHRLLYENKTWMDLNPKTKNIYKLLGGPKLELD